MNFSRRSAVLILLFDDGQVTALVANGESTPLVAPIAVDPLLGDPALVGQELRERLRPLGRRLPRRVIVGIGLGRLMATAVDVPTMPDEAMDGFLRIQAEREFLLPPEELALAVSLSTYADGGRSALLVALPARQYANLQRALHLAGLSSCAVLPTIVGLADPRLPEARLVLSARACDLLVTAGGGIVLLRRLLTAEAGGLAEQGALDVLPGEVRISLRQLAASVRGELRGLAVTGTLAALAAVVPVLESEADGDPWQPLAEPAPAGPEARCCERLASLAVSGLRLPLTLAPLPAPRLRSWSRHWRPRQLVTAGAALAVVVLALAGLVLHQRWALATVREQWAVMGPRTEAVRRVVTYARSHGAWFSERPESLDVLRALTLAFPETGGVWATRVEIKERRHVTVAGKAAGREDWLRTLEALRLVPGVRDLRVSQARVAGDAKSPLTFALRFTWQPTAGSRTGGEAEP
jgi:hypothetical protein